MKIKHVFFDLDHTLWDFDANSDQSFRFIFDKLNIDLDFSMFSGYYYPINEYYWKLFREDNVSKKDLRFGRLNDTFKKMNHSISDAMINKLSEAYIDNLSNYNLLIEGALDILDYLKPKYNLHIITNGFQEVQGLKMEKSGLNAYFETVITSEEVGVKKPNPKIYNYALKTCNAMASESIMIGDNYEADVIGAIDSGLDAIFYNFKGVTSSKNIKTVTQLLQLKQYL